MILIHFSQFGKIDGDSGGILDVSEVIGIDTTIYLLKTSASFCVVSLTEINQAKSIFKNIKRRSVTTALTQRRLSSIDVEIPVF